MSVFGVFLIRIPRSRTEYGERERERERESERERERERERDTVYFSVFNANAGKYGPEKLRILTLFTQ